MVQPHLYAGSPSAPDTLHDPHRDATTLALIPAVVDAGIPVLAICRGFQEMNVAYGGSLHQDLPATGKYRDHQADDEHAIEVQYGPAHDVELTQDGVLREITGRRRLTVNSLHTQGVDRLGRRLAVEAVSADGLVEAFRVEDAPGFAVAVQWHPEWRIMDNPDSVALFRAFGEASRDYAGRQHHA
jgi:putative glutamine amidotransferase